MRLIVRMNKKFVYLKERVSPLDKQRFDCKKMQ